MNVLIFVLLMSVLGSEAAHAARSRQGGFVTNAIQRMAGLSKTTWLTHTNLHKKYVFESRLDLKEDQGIDLDSVVENFFATLTPDKLAELAKIYGADEGTSQQIAKHRLHIFMLAGATEVADKMVEMGLELDKVDLEGLLAYALQPHDIDIEKRTIWWAWLLKQGANIGNPRLITKLFTRATLHNDVQLLNWMKYNLFVEAEASRAILSHVLNRALPFAVRVGATEAAVWLLQHGANMGVLEETNLLRAAMQGYLVDTGDINLPLAQHIHDIDKSILDEMLSVIAKENGSAQNIRAMEHLQKLGASLTAEQLQKTLLYSIGQRGDWVMANWAMAQGTDINALDPNSIVSYVIDDTYRFNSNSRSTVIFEPTNIAVLFDFLRMHGVDQLDIAQLRSKAEEKNITAAIEQLQQVNKRVELIPAAEIWQQLYVELPSIPAKIYDAVGGKDFWLYEVVKDYWDKENFVWLMLYIGKIYGANTLTETLIEVVRFTPYLGRYEYNEVMDNLIERLGLAEQKEALAQTMLNRVFQCEEKHPFPLSFARWAVSNGANINQPDQHAIVRAIINNEMSDYRSPSPNDIIFFLQNNGFHFDGIDQQHILLETEASDAANYVLGRIYKERR